jgi:hypothetical protein
LAKKYPAEYLPGTPKRARETSETSITNERDSSVITKNKRVSGGKGLQAFKQKMARKKGSK